MGCSQMQRDEPVAQRGWHCRHGQVLLSASTEVLTPSGAIRKLGFGPQSAMGHMVMLDDVGGSMMFQACFVLIPTNVRMIRWSQEIFFGFLRGVNHRPSRFLAICLISLGTAEAKYPQAISSNWFWTLPDTKSHGECFGCAAHSVSSQNTGSSNVRTFTYCIGQKVIRYISNQHI